MIRWFLTFLALLLLVRLALRFLLGLLQGLTAPSGRRGATATRGRAVAATTLVRDPVCGTYIPGDGAVTAIVRGETRHYCSDACRAKDAEAARFNPVGRAAHG